MYENFVEEVDAVDNGISQYDGEARYIVSTTLSTRVSHLNPCWNSDCQDAEVSKENKKSLVFKSFMKYVNSTLWNIVKIFLFLYVIYFVFIRVCVCDI